MKLIINIPDEYYNQIMKSKDNIVIKNIAYACIESGTPLPKTHGRLKDVDAFISKVDTDRKHSAYVKSWTADDVLVALDNSYAPTIIAADDAESEG